MLKWIVLQIKDLLKATRNSRGLRHVQIPSIKYDLETILEFF